MRILNTSGDRELLLVRSEYLWTLGFDVENAFANARLHDTVKEAGAVDLAVLCYSLSSRQKLSLIEMIRRNFPSTQIMELYLADAPVSADAIEASAFRPMMKVLAAYISQSPFASARTIRPEYSEPHTSLDRAHLL
jgi:hypothetical protein